MTAGYVDPAQQADLWNYLEPPRPSQEEGRRLRDEGAETALSAADLRARGAAERALREIAKTGEVFTSDDLHSRVGSPLACGPAVMGSVFLMAAKAGVIEHVGYTQSRRAAAHGRIIKTWRGTGRSTEPPEPGKPPKAAHPSAPAPSGQWTTADVTAPCIRCGAPAFLRDPAGRPRHRAHCGTA